MNIEASERMGKLYDMLRDAGYGGHDLELFLVRILFCLFADDTGIFERTASASTSRKTPRRTAAISAPASFICSKPSTRRTSGAGGILTRPWPSSPYVNGTLFADTLPIPDFTSQMRDTLISTCYFNWGSISPAIFGPSSSRSWTRRSGAASARTTRPSRTS